jgi:hypothetical protein
MWSSLVHPLNVLTYSISSVHIIFTSLAHTVQDSVPLNIIGSISSSQNLKRFSFFVLVFKVIVKVQIILWHELSLLLKSLPTICVTSLPKLLTSEISLSSSNIAFSTIILHVDISHVSTFRPYQLLYIHC